MGLEPLSEANDQLRLRIAQVHRRSVLLRSQRQLQALRDLLDLPRSELAAAGKFLGHAVTPAELSLAEAISCLDQAITDLDRELG